MSDCRDTVPSRLCRCSTHDSHIALAFVISNVEKFYSNLFIPRKSLRFHRVCQCTILVTLTFELSQHRVVLPSVFVGCFINFRVHHTR
jgi:hypothetical protein